MIQWKFWPQPKKNIEDESKQNQANMVTDRVKTCQKRFWDAGWGWHCLGAGNIHGIG
jgi:hypothetical protein